MKKILSFILIMSMAMALIACGETTSDTTDSKRYSVVYENDAYILGEDGVLIETLSNLDDTKEPIDADPLDEEYIDESVDASIEAIEENDGETLAEADPIDDEDEDDVVKEKCFDNITIISSDDGFYLESNDGEILTKSYDILVDNYNGYTKVSHEPEKFIAYDSEGLHILDTDGNVKKDLEINNISYIKSYGDYFVYNVIGKSIDTSCGLMNMSLETLVEPTRYYELIPVFIYSTNESGEDNKMFVGAYKDTYGGIVYDVINSNGEIEIDSALSFAYVDSNRIAILRGATVGFMNFDGEWLTKNAI